MKFVVRSTDTFLENFSILERLVADSALRQSFKSVTEILFKLFYKINKFCSTCPIVTIIFLVFYSYDFIRGMHGINFVEITDFYVICIFTTLFLFLTFRTNSST